MKKLMSIFVAIALVVTLTACGGQESNEKTELNVVFVPSRDAQEILDATAPLADLLKAELSALGFDFETINVTVSSTYEAAGEAADAGTADVVFLPGGTYITYQDGLVPILAAARDSLTKDFSNAKDWNDGLPTENVTGSNDAVSYRSLLIVGPSDKGRELADIVNAGTELSWDDVKDAKFCVRGATSSAGYIFPNIWFNENFGKGLDALGENAVTTDGYGSSMSNLAAGTCDVATIYGDARMHNTTKWTEDFARELTIWQETDVIGVTDHIANDGIQVSKHMNVKLAEAIQTSFIKLIADENNKEIFDIYSHSAYSPITTGGYEGSRKAEGVDTVFGN